MNEEIVQVSGNEEPTFHCQCPDRPCLMSCSLFEIICEYCNHQESGTTGASQFADEVKIA